MKSQHRGIWYALWAILAGMLVVLVIARVAETARLTEDIRTSQVTNTRTLDNSSRLLSVVLDCTQRGGKCFEQGQRRTGSAVATIGETSVAAAVCIVSLPPEVIHTSSRKHLVQIVSKCVRVQLDQPTRKR